MKDLLMACSYAVTQQMAAAGGGRAGDQEAAEAVAEIQRSQGGA